MAAPTTQQSGYAYVIKTGGTTIGGGTNATLNVNAALAEATNKSSGRWKKTVCGTRSWSMDFESMYLVSAAEICGSNVSLKSSPGGVAVKGLKQMDLALSSEMFDSVNSTTGLWRQVVPGNRTMTVTISGDWYDFDLDTTSTGGDETLEEIMDAWMGSTTVSLLVTISTGESFAATTFRVTNGSIGFPHDGIIPYSFTLEAVGTPGTFTETESSGLGALFTDFFNAAGALSSTVLITNQSDYTEFTGTAYPESINISIPYDGVVSASGTFQGSGALTMQAAA